MRTRDESGWLLEASYAELPALLFDEQAPVPVRAPKVVVVNEALVSELGLDPSRIAGSEGAAWFSGTALPSTTALPSATALPPGARPLAQAYAGHQFGGFTMLGDGRALLLGEQISPDGQRWDVHLKGTGRTRFSRRGDGRAALGPMLREYLISEAMHALGIPTTRSLAVLTTGETVRRSEEFPGAILVRIAASHLRVGTVQYAAALDRREVLTALVDHAVARHVPADRRSGNAALDLLDAVCASQAGLIATWMAVGFVHGVMNTDNMALSGETIDYGPCAFLDRYDPAAVFSSIDEGGRYAFANQPAIAQWNLARLAEALLPLLDPVPEQAKSLANERVVGFGALHRDRRLAHQRHRLGLVDADAADGELAEAFLDLLAAQGLDHTLAWLDLLAVARGEDPHLGSGPAWDAWIARWQARRRRDGSEQASTALLAATTPRIIPRNHRVEEALAAAGADDWKPWNRLLAALRYPYDDGPDQRELGQPPPPGVMDGYCTFCGT